MLTCPCCGYRTLPSLGDYELCPVCWWEDDGSQPWEGLDGPNGTALVTAQQAFLSDDRPYRRREGKVRAPKRGEERDPSWRPLELTDELASRVERARIDQEAAWRRHESQMEIEGARLDRLLDAYNAAVSELALAAPGLSHREVRTRLAALGVQHEFPLPDVYLNLSALQLRLRRPDLRRHPLRATWWLLRHGRPGSYRRRWRELRTGSFTFAG